MNKELQELQDKLKEVEKTRDDLKRQILAKTSEDLLNKFEPGKYYEFLQPFLLFDNYQK